MTLPDERNRAIVAMGKIGEAILGRQIKRVPAELRELVRRAMRHYPAAGEVVSRGAGRR